MRLIDKIGYSIGVFLGRFIRMIGSLLGGQDDN